MTVRGTPNSSHGAQRFSCRYGQSAPARRGPAPAPAARTVLALRIRNSRRRPRSAGPNRSTSTSSRPKFTVHAVGNGRISAAGSRGSNARWSARLRGGAVQHRPQQPPQARAQHCSICARHARENLFPVPDRPDDHDFAAGGPPLAPADRLIFRRSRRRLSAVAAVLNARRSPSRTTCTCEASLIRP